MVFTPQKYSDICLDLYRGAQTHPITEFPSFMINTIMKFIDFDMAMFGLMSHAPDGKVVAHYGHLYNETEGALDEWLRFTDQDPIARDALNSFGKCIRYHTPTQYRDAELLDYAVRRRHINILALALPYGPNQVISGISLRRADSRWAYNDQEKLALEVLMPHVCEAFRINRVVFSHKNILTNSEPIRGLCIFDNAGIVVYQDESFCNFARALYTDFEGFKIPLKLHKWFCEDRQPRMVMGNLLLCVTKNGHLYFLSIRPLSKLDVLTDREQTVAKFYGTGLTYKEIGAELSISPSTTRRHIEAIYMKLKIKNKADLAFLVHANTGSMSADKLFAGL